MKKKILGILCVLVAVLVMSHNAGAVDLDIDVSTMWTGTAPSYVQWTTSDGLNHNTFVCGGGTDYRTKVTVLTFEVSPVSSVIKSGDILVLSLSGTSDGNSNVNIDFARELKDSLNNFEVLDIKYSQAGHSSMGVDLYLFARSNGVIRGNIIRNGGWPWFTMNNTSGTECMTVGNWALYRVKGDSSQAIVNAINNNNSSTAINNAKDAIVGAIEEQQQKEQAAVDNIENQTPQDLSSSGNTENQASSNLIDLIRSFVSALTTINTGNCDITLDFPSYAGGSRTVNICQNKDKAGNLISVFSSLTLIVFYIPLAFKLLTMIYNEIRSFTNG